MGQILRKESPGTLACCCVWVVLGCIGLFVLRTRLNRAFRSVFRFVSDDVSHHFRVVCTRTAFLSKSEKLFVIFV